LDAKIQAAIAERDATRDELVTLRSIINGKRGERTITPEQQAAMQAARKKKS